MLLKMVLKLIGSTIFKDMFMKRQFIVLEVLVTIAFIYFFYFYMNFSMIASILLTAFISFASEIASIIIFKLKGY